MQHFKFNNWRIGGLENSIFDVTNRLIESDYFSAVTQYILRIRTNLGPITYIGVITLHLKFPKLLHSFGNFRAIGT